MQGLLIRLWMVILSGVSLSALYVVLGVFFPLSFEKTRKIASDRPRRAFLTGFVIFLFFGSIAGGFFTLGHETSDFFYIPGLFIAVPLAVSITLGLGGVIRMVGDRLYEEQSDVKKTFYATLTLYVACLTPVVGWFGLTIFASITGLGAFLLGLTERKPGSSAQTIEEAEEVR